MIKITFFFGQKVCFHDLLIITESNTFRDRSYLKGSNEKPDRYGKNKTFFYLTK